MATTTRVRSDDTTARSRARLAGRLSLAALLLVAAAGPAAAQRPPGGRGVVRGVVTGMDGEPVPYAVVALLPGYDQRFTDEAGRFAFQQVVPGTYSLLARQVGYKPGDTTLTVAAGAAVQVSVTLEHLTVRLEAIQVVASRGCTAPGPPDSVAQPELARVFDQLELNAMRYRLLAGSYPYQFRMERAFRYYDAGGRLDSSSTDTVRIRSSGTPGYRAGQVVEWGRGPGTELSLVLSLPTLSDFADSGFQASHCFAYEGVVVDSGVPVVRFAYEPAEFIRTPDIEGHVDLDPATYQVKEALVALTHPGRALEGMASVTSRITYTELYPNVLLQSRIHGENIPLVRIGAPGRDQIVRYVQDQRLLDVQFVRPLPGRPSDAAPTP